MELLGVAVVVGARMSELLMPMQPPRCTVELG